MKRIRRPVRREGSKFMVGEEGDVLPWWKRLGGWCGGGRWEGEKGVVPLIGRRPLRP